MVSKQKQIAEERVHILFDQARKIFNDSSSLADKYVNLARKISMRYKVRLPRQYKKLFCKKCYRFLKPGKTLTARTKNKILIYTCKNCGHITRYPINSQKRL